MGVQNWKRFPYSVNLISFATEVALENNLLTCPIFPTPPRNLQYFTRWKLFKESCFLHWNVYCIANMYYNCFNFQNSTNLPILWAMYRAFIFTFLFYSLNHLSLKVCADWRKSKITNTRNMHMHEVFNFCINK